MIWEKIGRAVQTSGESTTYYRTKDGRFTIESRKPAANQPGRFHPTQKPVELYKWLLMNYAKNGETILDTHAGSASSLIACRQTNHKYVGFEIDAEYYQKARKRLDAEEAQMNLWDLGFNPYQE